MSEYVLYKKENFVATITLNDNKTRNSLTSYEMIQSFVNVCNMINSDVTIRVAILTGTGNVFSSGGNIKDMANKNGMFAGDAATLRQNYKSGIQQIILAAYNLEVPLIAAVNGPAYGAGCDLALMSDIRYASTNASFATNFIKLGLIPGDGGAWILPRVIGRSKANEMAYTGDPVSAETALSWGMVSKVVNPDHLIEETMQMALRISKNSSRALRATKKLLTASDSTKLDNLLELSASFQAIAHTTEEHHQALRQIKQK